MMFARQVRAVIGKPDRKESGTRIRAGDKFDGAGIEPKLKEKMGRREDDNVICSGPNGHQVRYLVTLVAAFRLD